MQFERFRFLLVIFVQQKWHQYAGSPGRRYSLHSGDYFFDILLKQTICRTFIRVYFQIIVQEVLYTCSDFGRDDTFLLEIIPQNDFFFQTKAALSNDQ